MKLCRRCWRIWLVESIYCGHCRLPFDAPRCPNGHPNPGHRDGTCIQCNQGPLSGMVPSFSLRWLTRLLSLLCLLLLAKGVFHWFPILWGMFIRTLIVLTAFITSSSPKEVECMFTEIITVYVVLYIVSFLLPEKPGSNVRTLLKLPLRVTWWMIKTLFHSLTHQNKKKK